MRTALTLTRLHGETNFGTTSGPEVAIDQQISELKKLAGAGKTHPEIAEAQLWISDHGCTKRLRFQQPAPELPVKKSKSSAPKS